MGPAVDFDVFARVPVSEKRTQTCLVQQSTRMCGGMGKVRVGRVSTDWQCFSSKRFVPHLHHRVAASWFGAPFPMIICSRWWGCHRCRVAPARVACQLVCLSFCLLACLPQARSLIRAHFAASDAGLEVRGALMRLAQNASDAAALISRANGSSSPNIVVCDLHDEVSRIALTALRAEVTHHPPPSHIPPAPAPGHTLHPPSAQPPMCGHLPAPRPPPICVIYRSAQPGNRAARVARFMCVHVLRYSRPRMCESAICRTSLRIHWYVCSWLAWRDAINMHIC